MATLVKLQIPNIKHNLNVRLRHVDTNGTTINRIAMIYSGLIAMLNTNDTHKYLTIHFPHGH